MIERRMQREANLNKWIVENDKDQGFAKAITDLDALTQESAQAYRKEYWYTYVTRPSLYSAARRLYRLSIERQKPDAERASGYQERDAEFFTQGMQAIDRRYDQAVDKAEWLMF